MHFNDARHGLPSDGTHAAQEGLPGETRLWCPIRTLELGSSSGPYPTATAGGTKHRHACRVAQRPSHAMGTHERPYAAAVYRARTAPVSKSSAGRARARTREDGPKHARQHADARSYTHWGVSGSTRRCMVGPKRAPSATGTGGQGGSPRRPPGGCSTGRGGRIVRGRFPPPRTP